ncbi:MAG: phosphonate ABC transporter ATP-binding protein [Acidimicrobiales bacterium]
MRFGALAALEGIDLTIAAGERVALVGRSGAGKSTLISVLNGTLRPTSGGVDVGGQDLAACSPRQLKAAQARIGTIHQQFDLVGPLRVVHNVNGGRLCRWSLAKASWSLLAPREVEGAEAALARVGIAGKLFERTDRLSGGEQQRVALARVLVQGPDAILADEPIASLDPARAREVMDLLRDLAIELGRTLVVSVHAYEYATTHFDRVVGLRDGRVALDAPASAVDPGAAAALYRISDAERGR